MDTFIWIALLLVFLVIEAACPIHLVSIWFAAGSLVAAIVSMLHGQLWLQVLLFVVVSGGLLACLWPFVKKFLRPHLTKTNVDSVVSTEGYVTEAVDNLSATGQVKLGGMYWTARSASGENIPQGTLIKVEKIEGVKVFVAPVTSQVQEEVAL